MLDENKDLWTANRFCSALQAGLLASFNAKGHLPGNRIPVIYKSFAPVHSDGIAPDSHRLPFSPGRRTPPDTRTAYSIVRPL